MLIQSLKVFFYFMVYLLTFNNILILRNRTINFHNQTIEISGKISKNRNDGLVTIPNELGKLMMDLKIYEYPTNYYLFSDGFKPGINRKSEKTFRTYWLKVRRELKLPENYHFYSFKDTGIQHLLRNKIDKIAVRDQARHSSIVTTEMYDEVGSKAANKEIINLNAKFGI